MGEFVDVDFTAEVERSVRVLDGAVTIVDGVAGVQAQTETVWAQANRYHVPRIVFINKMDRDGASVQDTMESVRTRLRTTPLLTQLPLGGVSKHFSGLIDLISLEELQWDQESLGLKYRRSPLDKNARPYEIALEARNSLVEALAELDESLMEHIFSTNTAPVEVAANLIRESLRRVTLANKAVPVLLGSSLKNIGVQPVMDAVIDYLPSPLERAMPLAFKSKLALESEDAEAQLASSFEIACDAKSALVAQAFKVVHEARTNMLVVYVRVYSGTLTPGTKLSNTTKGKEERSLRLTRVRADRFEDLKELQAGDIGAVTGLKNTSTGDTLVGMKDPPVCVQGMNIPEPVFFMSILADNVSDEDHLRTSLNTLQLEDPSFKWMVNKDTGQWLLCGMGELHLDIIKDRLFNYYKVKASTGDIQIAYKSTIKDDVTEHLVKSYHIGGRTEDVNLTLEIEPLEIGAGSSFDIDEGVFQSLSNFKKVKSELAQAFTEGANDLLRSGVPAGFPLLDVKVTLTQLSYNPSTSTHTYKLSLMEAMFNAARQAGVRILEPVMKVEVSVADDYAGGVLSDLTSKRNAAIEEVAHGGAGRKTIHCHVPLKDLMGYSTDLRSLSKGTASIIMEFSHNGPLTDAQQTKLLGTSFFN